MLQRATTKSKFYMLAEYLIPTDKQLYKQILKLSEFSKQIIFEIASSTALHLLNKRILNEKFEEGNKRGWAKKGNRMISIPARSTAHIFKDKRFWVIEIDNISREK